MNLDSTWVACVSCKYNNQYAICLYEKHWHILAYIGQYVFAILAWSRCSLTQICYPRILAHCWISSLKVEKMCDAFSWLRQSMCQYDTDSYYFTGFWDMAGNGKTDRQMDPHISSLKLTTLQTNGGDFFSSILLPGAWFSVCTENERHILCCINVCILQHVSECSTGTLDFLLSSNCLLCSLYTLKLN